MIELTIEAAGLTRMERALIILRRDQVPYAMSRALNDCAQAATRDVNKAMAHVFDRPTKFTERAAIAPRQMAATKNRLVAELTLRPIQAQYLQLEETGGTRTGEMNTGKKSKTVLLPGKSMELNEFGNIPRNALAKLRAEAARAVRARRKKAAAGATIPSAVFLPAIAPGNKAGIAGWFRRLPGHGLTRLTAFEQATSYHARLGYHARVDAAARATWPRALPSRLHEAIRSAR